MALIAIIISSISILISGHTIIKTYLRDRKKQKERKEIEEQVRSGVITVNEARERLRRNE